MSRVKERRKEKGEVSKKPWFWADVIFFLVVEGSQCTAPRRDTGYLLWVRVGRLPAEHVAGAFGDPWCPVGLPGVHSAGGTGVSRCCTSCRGSGVLGKGYRDVC